MSPFVQRARWDADAFGRQLLAHSFERFVMRIGALVAGLEDAFPPLYARDAPHPEYAVAYGRLVPPGSALPFAGAIEDIREILADNRRHWLRIMAKVQGELGQGRVFAAQDDPNYERPTEV
jgi:hypothetical protein